MSRQVKITVAVTALLLASQTNSETITFIDVEVLRQTDKAVLVLFKDGDGENTQETEWLPLKALEASKLLGQDIYTVSAWFNDHVDHNKLNGIAELYGYKVPISINQQ